MTLKDGILQQLEQHRGEDLSGEDLARSANVSRAAVWKAIRALREDGYDIRSATKKGYRLSGEDDHLSADAIRAFLPDHLKSLCVTVLPTVDSTNNEAKRIAASGVTEPCLILAEEQTAGRGRLGRNFYSPAGTGLYMTLLYRVGGSLSAAIPVTSAAAVAVAETVEALTDKQPGIKWVNDVYLGEKKICGILTEAVTDMEADGGTDVIVGIGLNVSTDSFPEELQKTAASLFPAGVTCNRFASEIAARLMGYAAHLSDKAYLSAYRAHSTVLGKVITYRRGEEENVGTVTGIDDDCGLIVRRPDGSEETLRTGEITVRLKKNG